MAKNQKLGAMEQAIQAIAEYEASPLKKEIQARQQAGFKKALEDRLKIKAGKAKAKGGVLMKARGGTFKGTF